MEILQAIFTPVVFNSTIRQMAPILFVALASAVCKRVNVFNVALEGMMLAGAFFGVVFSWISGNAWVGLLGALGASMLVGAIVAVFQVKLKSPDIVVGVSINMFIQGLTTFLITVIFGTRGFFRDSNLQGLTKIPLPFEPNSPLGTLFGLLTPLDLFAFIMAILLFLFMFRTVPGFRMRSVGINKEATVSMGTKAERVQIITVIFSGLLCGLGGCLLSLGQVTMFSQNMTSGRGFVAMAASNLGAAHPLGVIVSSFFFGFTTAIGDALQSTTDLRSQLTSAIPYAATVIGLVVFGIKDMRKRKKSLI